MKKLITLLTFYVTTLVAAPQPSVFPPGKLVLCLHELSELGPEDPNNKTVGALTMRLGAAISQQPGIIMTSPALWHNLWHHRQLVARESRRTISLYKLMTYQWNNHHKNPSNKSFSRLHALLKRRPDMLNSLFLWQLDISAANWTAYSHDASGLIVLIPKEYVATRQKVQPRRLSPKTPSLDLLTSLQLSTCTPLPLPELADDDAVTRLVRHAHRQRQEKLFSIEHLAQLFVPQKHLPELAHVQWIIYAMGHGQLHSQRDEWRHLKQTNTTDTHDTDIHEICGLPLLQFHQLLEFCNAGITTTFFYYQSCYGGGQHLAQLYRYNVHDRTLVGPDLNLKFPLVAGAISEAPVNTIMPRYTQSSFSKSLNMIVDIDLPTFFEAAQKPNATLAHILRPLSPPVPSPNDIHAISGTPLVLLPGASELIPIDVTDSTQASNLATTQHSTRAGLKIITHHSLRNQPNDQAIVVRGKRALLVAPFTVSPPVALHPYQPTAHVGSIPLPPALVSIAPGNSVHHFKKLFLHDINLKQFLLHSFLQLTKQRSTKVYLCDELHLDNDLATNFTNTGNEGFFHTIASWFSSKPSALTTQRITLRDVVIYLKNDRIDCYFVEPRTDDATIARHVTYQATEHAAAHEKLQLTMASISDGTHKKLYKKYKKLLARQMTGRAVLSDKRLVPGRSRGG